MSDVIGVVEKMGRRGAEEVSVEWKIPNFPSLLHGRDGVCFWSPLFRFGDGRWCLEMWPNWKREAGNRASRWVRLDLFRYDRGPPSTVRFSVGIKGSGGVEKSREGENVFKGVYDFYRWDDFCSRSYLLQHRTRLMPDDTLIITCVLKRPGAAREGLLEKEVEVLKEQIKTPQKTAENYECESQNYKKEISTLESEKLSIAEENKGLLEEKLTLEKDNDLLKKEVEALMEQIKTLEKTVENYESESQNYNKEIRTLESEKLSIAEEYKSMLEEKLAVVSGLEKDNDLLKKEVEALMEHAKTLQKTVENYELESQNYKKEISTLESEKLSIAEEYKGLLEEKLAVVSGLKKEDLLEKEVEALKEQIKTLQKTVENYELESQNYKKEISTLESEKLSIAEENKGLLEEKLTLEKDNDLLEKEEEALMEQIKTLQKTVENYELESQNYEKEIRTLESEKLSIAEEYKSMLEEKLAVVSGLEKDNDLLKKVVEALMEQTKTLQKTSENYELESQNYKKQISTLESEKLSIAEEYKSLLEEKLTVVSGLEKDNDLRKNGVEFFMEQIKTLQKTIENYELESQNYKKRISTLESEKLAIAEEYKGLLEEKLTVVSGLEKEISDSKIRINELQEMNQTLMREKSQYEMELQKLKESASFRNQDIVESEERTRTSGYERVHLKDENSQSRSDTLSFDFSDLYADEASPNFVLKCNGWSIPVNTFVLSVRSGVFRDMFRNIVLREDETGSADIEDLEVPVLMSMLKFLYCGKLEDVSEDTVADLYQAGHAYARSLKWACCHWMETNLTRENCVTFLKVADSHSDRDLRAVVVTFIVRHPGVMKTAAWLSYSNEHPKLANDVQQAYISSIIP